MGLQLLTSGVWNYLQITVADFSEIVGIEMAPGQSGQTLPTSNCHCRFYFSGPSQKRITVTDTDFNFMELDRWSCRYTRYWGHKIHRITKQFQNDFGGAYTLTAAAFRLQLSFFAYSLLRCLLDTLSHCKQKAPLVSQKSSNCKQKRSNCKKKAPTERKSSQTQL